MRVQSLLIVLAAASLLADPASAATDPPAPLSPAGALVEYLLVQYPSISPNGDGVRDSSLVRIGIADTCSTLLLALIDEWGTPLDTIIEAADVPPGTVSGVWKGTGAGGAVLPEGAYRLRLAASSGALTEERESVAIVDLTAPLAAIERIEPGIYAPGVPGTAETLLVYTSIERYGPGDTLSMTITNPGEGSERLAIAISGDGLYRTPWTAVTTAPDGMYRVAVAAADEAGNASSDSAVFDVDTQKPTQAFIDAPPEHTNEPPAVICGRAYDRNGVYGLELVWDGGEPFSPDSVYMIADTLFWRFDALDSLVDGGGYIEGTHTLAASCSDLFAGSSLHESRISTTFELDLEAPAAPILDEPASPVRVPSVVVRGSIEWPGTKYVYLHRTAATDTTIRYEPAGDTFAKSVPLELGTNVIRATAEDRSLNESDLSNAVTVVYQPADEVTWPEVFREPGTFQIFAAEQARQVTVDIYTVSGERVATLRENGPAQSFSVEWDLTNDDGEEVRNGPYLAVVSVKYDTRTATYKKFVAVVR